MRSPVQTNFKDLPDELAVFPLSGALVLPGGRLPLNIFEPRYLNLALDALKSQRIFGMIQPDPQQLAGPTGPHPSGARGPGRAVRLPRPARPPP